VRSIVWFRHDLRLSDHPALTDAVKRGKIIPVYVLPSDEFYGPWKYGSAYRWWLHWSLRALEKRIQGYGGNLILRCGDVYTILPDLVKTYGISQIYTTSCLGPVCRAYEKDLGERLAGEGVKINTYNSSLLHNPLDFIPSSMLHYEQFGDFWKALQDKLVVDSPLSDPPLSPDSFIHGVEGDDLRSWRLCPVKPNWAAEFHTRWEAGEAEGMRRLNNFIKGTLPFYIEGRDYPSRDQTSCLSPYIKTGMLSVRQVWSAVQNAMKQNTMLVVPGMKFLTRLAWREFSYYLIANRPELLDFESDKRYRSFEWVDNLSHLRAWQQGKTGYPLIDAGMRELWRTGYMHSKVRQVVSAFLTRGLSINWRHGAQWFWDTLIDADIAANSVGWQSSAGVLGDACLPVNVINPVAQSKKLDPQGTYIKKWVPELTSLSSEDVHAPWKASPAVLKAAGVYLDVIYPKPIISLEEFYKQALDCQQRMSRLAGRPFRPRAVQ
jgi:deoxyribodipyrimidine photo-lyase